MNHKDMSRLERLTRIMDAVPLPSPLTPMDQRNKAAAAYEQDMRAFGPAVKAVLDGMVQERRVHTSGRTPTETELAPNGFDDPDLLLDALEKWVDMRRDQNWEGANSQSLHPFWVDARRQMRTKTAAKLDRLAQSRGTT